MWTGKIPESRINSGFLSDLSLDVKGASVSLDLHGEAFNWPIHDQEEFES
jgi:hypothetical protein